MTREDFDKAQEIVNQISDIEDQEHLFDGLAEASRREGVCITINIDGDEIAFGDDSLVKAIHGSVMKTVKSRKATLNRQLAKL